MSSRAIAGFSIVLLLTACSAAGDLASPLGPTAPANTSATSGGASSSAASELEGVWHSGVVTPDDAMAALQAADLQQYAQGFFDFWKIGNENVFSLRIRGGKWICSWSREGGPFETEDDGQYSISGNTVTIQHNDVGADTFEWSVTGDTLTITYQSDTIGSPDFPRGEEVYQRVLYMSSSWTRGVP